MAAGFAVNKENEESINDMCNYNGVNHCWYCVCSLL
jgi:hypothetical protein